MKKLLLTTFILLAMVNLCRASLFGDTNRIRRDIFNLFTAAAPVVPATPITPAKPDVSPVQPSLPATNTEGWQFDASRNVWWRLTPVNTDPFATTNQLPQVNSVTPGRIFPSNFLPGGSQRGMFTLPSRSIQNCGPSG